MTFRSIPQKADRMAHASMITTKDLRRLRLPYADQIKKDQPPRVRSYTKEIEGSVRVLKFFLRLGNSIHV